jgi:hypothetical protein
LNRMEHTTVELEQAIENLYEVFSKYPYPQSPSFGDSPFYDSQKDAAALAAKPLREIEPGILQVYVQEAYFDWGDTNDFKHFLPRALEVMARYEYEWLDSEVVMSRLMGQNSDGWQTWSLQEQKAIHEFAVAWWKARIRNSFISSDDSWWWDTQLCILGQAFDDLAPFLNIWRDEVSLDSTLSFADFVTSFLLNNKKEMGSAYWGNSPDIDYQKIWIVLVTPEVLRILRERHDIFPHAKNSTVILKAIQVLEGVLGV